MSDAAIVITILGAFGVVPFAVGCDNPFQPCRPVEHCDSRAGHRRAVRIQGSALKRADRLGVKRSKETEEQDRRKWGPKALRC